MNCIADLQLLSQHLTFTHDKSLSGLESWKFVRFEKKMSEILPCDSVSDYNSSSFERENKRPKSMVWEHMYVCELGPFLDFL